MQVENMEHNCEQDSDITVTNLTSSEEPPCEEVAEISKSVVTGKHLFHYVWHCVQAK